MPEFNLSAEKISLDAVDAIEKVTPNLIVWAAPAMFFFVIIEYIIAKRQNKQYYDNKETIGSTLVGLGNVAIGLLLKTGFLYLFIIIYNWVPWRLPFSWWSFVVCYIIFDLCSYWAHHVSHKTRFFWATHVAHHSGEHYNLTVSFRLSWVQYIKIIFFLPVGFLGFHPIVILTTNQVAVLFQFWVHTEYIRKLHPVVEYIFATPSNHRVHHGSEEKYINKNYGATFIIWDRIFGTYVREEGKIVYGLTHNIDHKHDPIHINFHEYSDIIRDVKSAKNLREALFYIFGDPADVDRYKKLNLADNKSSEASKPVTKNQSIL
ncbi:MAG TPA: sterol desaturase family protein [Ohtaekwangia sp.]